MAFVVRDRLARRARETNVAMAYQEEGTYNLFCFCLAMSIHEGDGLTSSEATTLLLVGR